MRITHRTAGLVTAGCVLGGGWLAARPAAAWGHGPAPAFPAGAAGTIPWDPSVLRSGVLLATAAVAGLALLRPLSGPPGENLRLVAVGTGAVAALGTLLSIWVHRSPPSESVLQAALVLATAALLARPLSVVLGVVLVGALVVETAGTHVGAALAAGAVHVIAATVWLGAALAVALAGGSTRGALLRRLAPWALGAVLLVVATGAVQAWYDGLRVDATSGESAFGRIVLLKVVLALLAVRAGMTLWHRLGVHPGTGPVRLGVGAVAFALVAGTTLAVLPHPPAPPVPGVPLLRTVAAGGVALPVVVIPQQPGANLVHVGGHDEQGVAVGLDPDGLTAVTARPGSSGGWVLVDLPPGRSRLWVSSAGRLSSLRLDTGRARSPVADQLSGADGPECAGAALGALLAGSGEPLGSCPADRLEDADAAVLRQLVTFLAGRRVPSVTVEADSSPRSVQATQVIRVAAAAKGLGLTVAGRPGVATAGGPGVAAAGGAARLVTAGWAGADQALRRLLNGGTVGSGTYLAPWLATGRLLRYSSGAVVALRFDPQDGPARAYVAALQAALPGEGPSVAGLAAWLATRHQGGAAPTTLYAAAQVSYLPAEQEDHHAGGGWVTGGRLTPVTGPLAG